MMMKKNGLYIQLFSIHGLIRGSDPELGRDADTGGQVKYVLELAQALCEHPEVRRVDLVTRLINDRQVATDYANRFEPLGAGARIVRIQCGGRKYIRKEMLWPHLDECIDKTLQLVKEEGEIPDIFHGHYADGGYVAKELANIFGTPFFFTGHSMGRHKKQKLLLNGMTDEEINRRYRIDHRIRIEERIIKDAERIITSTRHEIREQYGLYDNGPSGRYSVIPPGIDIKTFHPYDDADAAQTAMNASDKQARIALLHELHRFWVGPHKPFILALCRPDHRKNIAGLIRAYAEDPELRNIANLAIFAGIRKDITTMEENEQQVLTEMLLLLDQYDLYGKLAIPKKHNFATEVPELYRLCADSRGVFVNPALVEPFGITLIEAAACGLPIVATREGGPADIVENCQNGILVDPNQPTEIGDAIKNILNNKNRWKTFSKNGIRGVRHHYAWNAHCHQTVKEYRQVLESMPEATSLESRTDSPAIGRRLNSLDRLLITDVDNTLVGDQDSLTALLQLLQQHRRRLGWGISTGRHLEQTLEVLEEHHIPRPDILITAVATEIYYGASLLPDRGWQQHLSYKWQPGLIRDILADLDFLTLQEPESQRRFKISYYIDPEENPQVISSVHEALHTRKIHYNLVFSLGQYLDIIPYRASRGKAVRYLSYKWLFPLYNIMTCGDSGKDESMLRGDTCGLVVGNYHEELEPLRNHRRVYFSDQQFAAGIIDGMKHYNFLQHKRLVTSRGATKEIP